jgi:Ion channel
VRPRLRHLSLIWASDWGLTVFLVLIIVVVFVISPLGRESVVSRLFTAFVFSLLLISGLATVLERRALMLLGTGLIILTISFHWIAHLAPNPGIRTVSAISTIASLGLMSGVVLIQVFRKGPITAHRIQGAVAVYLLLGLIWEFAYELILIQYPGSFQPAALVEQRGSLLPNLTYFSFVTLTTVGYGDITPVHPMAKSLAILEALVGQLYPAILIGRLVAMELQTRASKKGGGSEA